jgi:hypothetical protein
MPLDQGDVQLLVRALDRYVNRRDPWIQKLSHSDWEDDVIACIEGLSFAATQGDLLRDLSEPDLQLLHNSGAHILAMKIDPYAKEGVVELARGLPPALALSMLRPIMDGKARGDVRKALKETLHILEKAGEG